MQLCIARNVNNVTRYQEKNLFYPVEDNQRIFSDKDTTVPVMHNILHLFYYMGIAIVWFIDSQSKQFRCEIFGYHYQ